MTRSQIAALVLGLVIVLAGGGAWWLHGHRTLPAVVAERLGVSTNPAAPNVIGSDQRAATRTASPEPAAPGASPEPPKVASLAPQPAPPDLVEPSPAPSPPTLPAPASPTVVPAPPAVAANPSFDIVRVEPRGDAVVAGKSAPNANVRLMDGGKVLGEAKSDANGQFVILPPPLKPGDHDLTLRQATEGKPAEASAQSVAVSVPHPGKGSVVVALAEPGKATKLLSRQPEPEASSPPAAAPLPPGKVSIRSVELENGTGFYASGTAPPKANIQVYLNNSHIADVIAGADGTWSIRVRKGLTGGHYVVRADIGHGADRQVVSRAEVPFDVPLAMAASPPPDAVASAAPQEPRAATAATSQTAEPTSPTATPPATTTPASPPSPSPAAPSPAASAASPAPSASPAAKVVSASPAPPPATVPPAAPSQSVASAQDNPEIPEGVSADVTVDSVATARVTAGDNLWHISRSHLGHGKRYTQIYAANSSQIRDPNLIYPGQVLVVPSP